jgi:hypothetical protein
MDTMRNSMSARCGRAVGRFAAVAILGCAALLTAAPAQAAGHGGGGHGSGGHGYGHHGYGHHGGWGWGPWLGLGAGVGLGLGLYDFWPEYYGYPYPVAPAPVTVIEQPPVVIQAAPPQASWYYCDNPAGYYPYVPSCGVPWRQVPATPPTAVQ